MNKQRKQGVNNGILQKKTEKKIKTHTHNNKWVHVVGPLDIPNLRLDCRGVVSMHNTYPKVCVLTTICKYTHLVFAALYFNCGSGAVG